MFNFFKSLFGRKSKDWVKRKHQRFSTNECGRIVVAGREQLKCRIVDISVGGARIELSENTWLPDEFEIETAGFYRRASRVWSTGNFLGVQWLVGDKS